MRIDLIKCMDMYVYVKKGIKKGQMLDGGFLCVFLRGWGCLSFHTTEGGVG